MKPITAGFTLVAFLAAATTPDVLLAGPQANAKNVTSTNQPYLRFQLGTAAVGKVQWGSTGGAPAGGGGGTGKVHKLDPNGTLFHR
jgi:hypothetical protein